ncbi:MAG: hypothetical protein HFE45_06930 [Oscillospiraceae bacterium]|nr:hypothetical protein [Oscillospiraceae bacterium]
MQKFRNEKFGEIRMVIIDNDPWFVGKDVALALGYVDTVNALKAHVDAEDKRGWQITTPGGDQTMVVVNESGLYSLILSSKLQSAKEFKRWVTNEVLPSIRKHGAYMTPATVEAVLSDPDTMIRLLQEIKAERQQREALEAKAEADRPKVLFADAVAVSGSTVLVGELAKILKQNGVEIGQNRLFGWLRRNGYLIRRQGTDYNMPTQYSMELGLFEIKETAVTHSDGHVTVSKTPKITGRGQQYFIAKFLEPAKDGIPS